MNSFIAMQNCGFKKLLKVEPPEKRQNEPSIAELKGLSVAEVIFCHIHGAPPPHTHTPNQTVINNRFKEGL